MSDDAAFRDAGAPVLRDQLVGQVDDVTGATVLTGRLPGPAGWSGIDLAGGSVRLLVDHADPVTVARLELAAGLELADPRAPAARALATLFGRGWPEVHAALVSDLTEHPRIVWPGTTYGRGGVGGAAAAVAAQLGRLAVVEAERGQASTRVASAVGALEAAVERAALPPTLAPPAAVAAALVRAGRALASSGATGGDAGPWDAGVGDDTVGDAVWPGDGDVDDELAARGWGARLALAALVARAAGHLETAERAGTVPDGEPPAAVREVSRALRELETRWRGEPDAGQAAAGAPPIAPMAARAPRFDAAAAEPVPAVASLPAPAGAAGGSVRRARTAARPRAPEPPVQVEIDATLDVTVMASRLEPAHLHVTARTGVTPGRPLWLRVFRRDRRPVLLGLGPLTANAFGSATGTVLLPAELRATDLVADITDRPGDPWRSRSVRSTQRAVRLGRDACRAERRDVGAGGIGAAAGAWAACAAQWAQQGDDRRADLASAYAAGRSGDQRQATGRQLVEPLVIDRFARP